jgi:hypothetical protein
VVVGKIAATSSRLQPAFRGFSPTFALPPHFQENSAYFSL